MPPGHFALLLLLSVSLSFAQQTSLRFPASPPALNYATVRAFGPLSFTQPVALVTPPGDTRRLFVVEKPGRIHVIPDVTAAEPTRTLFLDLTDRVSTGGGTDERGLLALAFHPDYAANGQFFVWYTTTATTAAGSGLHNRLSRFRVSSDPNVADANSEEPLITQRDEANNHNGGELLFGPDGYLYLSLGDEGGANDQYQNAHRIDRDFFAAILRLDVDRRPGSLAPNSHPAVHANTYAIPPDNPFLGATSHNGATVNPSTLRTEFWTTGLRNPWRMAFDPATGRLWLGDVGQGQREEINVITRGGDYGWPYREGNLPGPRGSPPANAGFVEPIWAYGRSDGLSVTGGLVYRGSGYAGALTGRYLFTDFGSGRLWALTPDGDNPVSSDRVQLLTTDSGISSFGLDPATGDILLADLLENTIKRLVITTPSNDAFPATLSATGAFANTAALTPAPGLVPYEPSVSFWSDHAKKRRWFALPEATSRFIIQSDDRWILPAGTVWVKHFDLELSRGDPATARRIETRFLVKTTDGVYGLTYRWNEAQTDATLVPDEGADQTFTIRENNTTRTQTWRFPSRAECLTCHTAAGGHALSFNTRQLNRGDLLQQLIASGYVSAPASAPTSAPALARADDPSASLEHRARSYLDANCSQCHQPGGTALGAWDARATVPLATANLFANSAIVPGDPARSEILTRLSTRGPGQMPPIATHERDSAGEALLREWILALAAPTNLPPPAPSRLINLAARAQLSSTNELITGFVVSGGSKRVLIRGIGPTLATFGVAGALADPALILLGPDSPTRTAATADNWNTALTDSFAAVGAFPLPPDSRDAALAADLAPGSYTVRVTTPPNTSGLALTEIYDLDPSAPARLANLSIRARVGTGDSLLIPGLTLGPGAPKTVLLRAVGPGLAPFGVTDFLSAPSLTLLSDQQRLLTNTRWGSALNAAEIHTAGTRVGAFALADADSAILTTLPPGNYTLQISGANNTTGTALVEIYEVP